MSGQCTGWVLRHGPKDRTLRLVLVAIADAANRDGEHSRPGVTAICEASLYSKRAVYRALDRLKNEGWLEVEDEGSGRGHATVYRVVMTERNGAILAQPDQLKGAILTSKGCHPDVERVPNSDFTLCLSTVNTNGKANASADADATRGDPAVAALCEHLADAIESHRDNQDRPKITAAWLRDMRLLVERGPLDVDDAKPQPPEKIRASIDYLYDRLAERGKDGFCWADVIRSPGKLRAKWSMLSDAARRNQAGRVSPSTQAVIRAGRKVAAERGETFLQPSGSVSARLFAGELSRPKGEG